MKTLIKKNPKERTTRVQILNDEGAIYAKVETRITDEDEYTPMINLFNVEENNKGWTLTNWTIFGKELKIFLPRGEWQYE